MGLEFIDDVEVARFKLPIPVDCLGAINKGLKRAYGSGLNVRQVGVWLVIEKAES